MSYADYDVLVVGAGPAGSTAAAEAAAQNANVMIIEEHKEPGKPPHCAGIIYDLDTFKHDIKIPDEFVQAKVRTVNLHFPRNLKATFANRFTIIDRPLFDRHLFEEATDKGVEPLLSSTVTEITNQEGLVKVHVRKGKRKQTFSARLVIGADGYRSVVGRQMGFNINHEVAHCIQYEVSPNPLGSDEAMDVYLGEYAAGGYAWVVPASFDKARIGLGVRREGLSAKHYLDKFFSKVGRGSKVLKVMGHCVPLSGPLETFFGHNVMLVGDAAGHVVPSSGAGVVSSIVSAKMAGHVAAESVKEGSMNVEILSRYQDRWKKVLGGKFKACSALKAFFDSLTEKTMEDFLDLFEDAQIRSLILKGRYMSAAIRMVIKKPWIIQYAPLGYGLRKYGVF